MSVRSSALRTTPSQTSACQRQSSKYTSLSTLAVLLQPHLAAPPTLMRSNGHYSSYLPYCAPRWQRWQVYGVRIVDCWLSAAAAERLEDASLCRTASASKCMETGTAAFDHVVFCCAAGCVRLCQTCSAVLQLVRCRMCTAGAAAGAWAWWARASWQQHTGESGSSAGMVRPTSCWSTMRLEAASGS